MSLYVSWTNRIKTLATPEWLTTGQRQAYEALLTKWRSHKVVCLIGPQGSGKSFIARLLHTEHEFAYVTDIREHLGTTSRVVVDGAPFSRHVLSVCQQLGLERVVVVQRSKPVDHVPCAVIELKEADVLEFRSVLFKRGVLQWFSSEAPTTDLERLLRDEAARRVAGV